MFNNKTDVRVQCDHCGDTCDEDYSITGEHHFCCEGCRMVYELLHENGMSNYYRFTQNPGISQKARSRTNLDYLNNPEIVRKLLSFREGGIAKITFDIPQIHCSSCLWLLEHLSMLDAGITKSVVNFVNKQASITYKEDRTSLRAVVELLHNIGYEPRMRYDHLETTNEPTSFDRGLIYKLGLAGFSFGNIMLLSFPEYLGFQHASYLFYLGYINLVLAIPVLVYSASDYFRSAYYGIKMKDFNIDVPIVLGMITLFGRSAYEILGHHGEGYLDSFAGFVFFLLIGRWFQGYTFRTLNFERNYKSYFPISTWIQKGEEWMSTTIDAIKPGDTIRIHNQEIIPVDGIIYKGKARIDYSFVTGESDLISKELGEEVFAGGRQQGANLELIVTKEVNESYLTQLWNEDVFKEESSSRTSRFVSHLSKYFTIVIIFLALLTMTVWFTIDTSRAFNAFTSVLIVACPCALALAIPFTYGHVLRLLSNHGFYLKNTNTIERIQDVDYLIFDKTGTLTDSNAMTITYHGKQLSATERALIKSTCSHSVHPLSRAIYNELDQDSEVEVDHFEDIVGKGIVAKCAGSTIRVGSSHFIFQSTNAKKEHGVFVEINGEYMGYFECKHALRANIKETLSKLREKFRIAVLSGDTDYDERRIRSILGADADVYFNQRPADKMNKIKDLQDQGHKIMMIGDGLNDAGALKQANVGIVVSSQMNNFSPACDGILVASQLSSFADLLDYLYRARNVLYTAFLLAFMYNTIGLYFAVTGQLSPVIAAILMPLSSISIILFGVGVSWLTFNVQRAESESR